MEFSDALKSLRSELGLAQVDIATALNVNIATVGRWEQGKTLPSRPFSIALLAYAKSKTASEHCMKNLEKSLNNATKEKLFNNKSSLYTVERATINQLIEDAFFPVYVCDLETDEILYANHVAEQQLGKSLDELAGQKCYQCIMHKDAPCEFCHKDQLVEDSFSGYEAFRRFDGCYYRALGKLVKWNGRDAHARYVFEIGGTVQITSKNALQHKYEQQLEMRRQFAGDALAAAHYNLTLGTCYQVEFHDKEMAKHLTGGTYEDIMAAMEDNVFLPEEKKKFDSIRDSSSLIKLFLHGKSHVSIKHRIKGLPGCYEETFDLFQNPITYDVEVFATLRDVTDEVFADQIVYALVHSNYETVLAIDAATGDTHPYYGKSIYGELRQPEKQGYNAAGTEEYLRRHCSDADVQRIIRQTGLPYVKEQLKTKPVWTVAYPLHENDRIMFKQIQYSYLDEEHATILCVMQDITESYMQLKA